VLHTDARPLGKSSKRRAQNGGGSDLGLLEDPRNGKASPVWESSNPGRSVTIGKNALKGAQYDSIRYLLFA
jgi:hypothetical protein